MSFEWKNVKLSEVVVFTNGKKRPDQSGEIPVYGGNGILDYTDRSNAVGEKVIIGRVGAYCGNVYYENQPCWISDNAIAAKSLDGNSNKYLFYKLKSLKLHNYRIGSSQPLLTQSLLKDIVIELPSRNEQELIENILSTLDDKIELNNAINKNLEEMAQALFKRWFIDFEFPNEKGELYKSSGGEFEESELGLIPKGWRVGQLGEIAQVRKQSIKPENMEEGTKYVGLEHVERKCLSLYKHGDAEEIESNKTLFYNGDILFGKLRPYFHKVCVAPFDGICSTDILSVYPKKDIYYGITVFYLFSDELVNMATQSSNGTRMPRTNWSTLSSYRITIPDNNTSNKFTELINEVSKTMKNNIFESSNLIQLRDSLLPKLMSGEIRVPLDEAESLNSNK